MRIYAVKIFNISEEKLNELCLLIDEDKKERIIRPVNKDDKIRSLIGEILIRTAIVENLNISNEHIKFIKNKYGKPYLKGYPYFNFNISHSGEYVICCIDNKAIGVDVEEIKSIDFLEVAKNYFTTIELEYMVNCDYKLQINRFYEIWTLKESYIKCCGKGLAIPLDSFSIKIDQFENIKSVRNYEFEKHVFKLFDINSCYKIAVCSLNKRITKKIIMLDQNILINNYIKYSFK